MKNIILLSPGNLNVGDNAILFTWLELFEKEYGKNCTVTVLGTETSYITQFVDRFSYKISVSDMLHRYIWKYYKNEKIDKKAFKDMLEPEKRDMAVFEPAIVYLNCIFEQADILHIVGGGLINNKWRDIHYIFLLAGELAKKYKTKVILTGQTVGPLEDEDEKRMEKLYQLADYIDLRDDSWLSYLKKCNSQITVTADDVFLNTLKVENTDAQLKKLIDNPHINVCLQQWNLSEEDSEKYEKIREEVRKIVEWYSDRERLDVNILEFSHNDGDMFYGKELFEKLPEHIKKKTHMNSCGNYYPGEVMQLIQTGRMNIGTRFHMALFSLQNSDCITISVAIDEYYRIKLENLHNLFHSSGYYDMEEFSQDNFLQRFENGEYYKKDLTKERKVIANLVNKKKETYFSVIGREKKENWTTKLFRR